MELNGKIKEVFDQQSFDSGFTKREFVVTTQEQYPQDIKFELIKDKCSLLDNFQKGDDVTVQFNIKGREYNGRYFVNLQAWRLEKTSDSPATEEPPFPDESFIEESEQEEDDLPF